MPYVSDLLQVKPLAGTSFKALQSEFFVIMKRQIRHEECEYPLQAGLYDTCRTHVRIHLEGRQRPVGERSGQVA